jgi:hypothetical protein
MNPTMALGIDLGDKTSHACLIDDSGVPVLRDRVRTSAASAFGGAAPGHPRHDLNGDLLGAVAASTSVPARVPQMVNVERHRVAVAQRPAASATRRYQPWYTRHDAPRAFLRRRLALVVPLL